MRFYNTEFLYLLVFLVFLFISGRYGIKRYMERKQKFIAETASVKLNLKTDTFERYFDLFAWLIIIGLSVVALARPLGGTVRDEVQHSGRDIVFLVDISESMRAEDTRLSGKYSDYLTFGGDVTFSRLEASKKVIKNFIKELNGDRVALVAFSGTAIPLIPLTHDYEVFTSFLDSVDYSYSSEGSTNLNEALEVAAKRFYAKDEEKKQSDIIIVFSDGEQHESGARETAETLKKEGITVFSVGTGTVEGSKIPMGKDFSGNQRFKTYLGQDIITRLTPETLKEISSVTRGRYFEITDPDFINKLKSRIEAIETSDFTLTDSVNYQELFQVFILIVIILLVAELFLPDIFRRFNINY